MPRIIELLAALVVAAKRKAQEPADGLALVPAIREPSAEQLAGFQMPLATRLLGNSNAIAID
jgi:hypothetical protein